MLPHPCTCYVACYVLLDTHDRGGYRCKMWQGERNGAKGSLGEIVITPSTTMGKSNVWARISTQEGKDLLTCFCMKESWIKFSYVHLKDFVGQFWTLFKCITLLKKAFFEKVQILKKCWLLRYHSSNFSRLLPLFWPTKLLRWGIP
jgi:hypothetical protein